MKGPPLPQRDGGVLDQAVGAAPQQDRAGLGVVAGDTTIVESIVNVRAWANALITENRAPISEFTQGGLQQVGPTLVELRTLIRDLRRVANRFDGNPAGYVLGREQPKEFEPE